MTDTQTRTIAARLLTRADDAATEGYDLTGIAVPFGEEYEMWGMSESFDRSCTFEGLERAKLYWQHRDAIGKITGSQIVDAGLQIDAAISRTRQGDEAATLVRDGVIDSLSIGFQGLDYRVEAREDGSELWVWTRVKIREVSLVSFPAYESATLTEVRHNPTPTKGNPTMTDTAPVLTRDDLNAVRDELGEQIRATQAQIAANATPATPEVQFRSFGEFIRAYHRGDEAAVALQASWADASREHTLHNQRAYAGGVLADTIAHSPWVGDAIRLIDKGRRVLNSFQTAPLPAEGNTLEYGVLESNTVQVAKQAAEGDDLVTGNVQVGIDSTTVATYGGASALSFQSVERASVSILDLTRRAQYIAYAQQTEAAVRAVLNATATANLAANHNLDLIAAAKAEDWVSLLIDAHDAYDDAALPIDGLFLSKDQFKKLATLTDDVGRLQFQVFGQGANAVGNLSISGLESEIGSVRVRLLPGAAANTGMFYSEQAITTWENAGAPLALEDSNVMNLTRAYAVYGYLACAAEIPDAILPIEFAV